MASKKGRLSGLFSVQGSPIVVWTCREVRLSGEPWLPPELIPRPPKPLSMEKRLTWGLVSRLTSTLRLCPTLRAGRAKN